MGDGIGEKAGVPVKKNLIVLSERKKRKFLDIRSKNRRKVGSVGVRNGGVQSSENKQ